MGIPSLSSFFGRTQDSEEKSEEESHDEIPHVDDPVTVDDTATFNEKEIEDINPPGVFANLLSEEEEVTERIEDELIDDDEYDTYNYDDDDNELSEHSQKVPSGVHQRYVWAVHERIKTELSRNFNGLETPWLLNHLKENDWWIRREHALRIVIKLSLPKEHLAYYQSLYIWIPDKRWGIEPCCPICKVIDMSSLMASRVTTLEDLY